MAPKVLVFLGTSRQGAATVDALVAMNKFEVYATTRSGKNTSLEAKGVKCVAFQNGDAAAAAAALDEVNPSLVWFATLMGTREVEGAQGKVIVDACKAKGGIEHVVFTSVADADKTSDAVGHFKSKADIEEHLAASGLGYSILRPVAFFDNFDDPANYNALTKGACKSLWPPELKVKYVACRDIGKAGAVMLASPKAWNGKTLDCAVQELTGNEVAEALTEASGVKCTYSLSMPRWMLGCLISKDLAAMVDHFESEGLTSEIEPFLKVVPDALNANEFFLAKGAWANGEKFEPE